MLWTTANGGTRKYITGKLSVSSRDAMKSQISADGSTIVFQSDADFRSEGSCYSMTTHQVTCNIAASACTSPNVHYAPGYVSSRNGCCHCVAGCNHTKETGANCAASNYQLLSDPQWTIENPGTDSKRTSIDQTGTKVVFDTNAPGQ